MTVVNFATRTVTHGCGEQVELNALASATGFPASFIKEELLLAEDTVDIKKLRELMLDYLQSTMGELA